MDKMDEKEVEKSGTVSPFFTKSEKKVVRILAAREGMSMRVWIRAVIMRLVDASGEKVVENG